jgi:hypothetical protein
VYAFGIGKGAQGRAASSSITKVPRAPTADTTGTARAAGAARSARASAQTAGVGGTKSADGPSRRSSTPSRKKGDELNAGLSTSQAYTVHEATEDWLTRGLPGRSDRTRQIYREALAPLLEKIGKRPLHDLEADEVEAGLRSLTGDLSSRSLKIAHDYRHGDHLPPPQRYRTYALTVILGGSVKIKTCLGSA